MNNIKNYERFSMKLPIRASILSAAALFCLPGFLAAQNAVETADSLATEFVEAVDSTVVAE